jgi:hypothetical protein
MAVKKVGPGQWLSTLTGHYETSEEAALHYDRLEAQKIRAGQDEGEKILDGLTAEQLKSLALAAVRRTDEVTNRPDGEDSIIRFVMSHPEYINEGADGSLNAGAMSAHLRGQGKFPPYRVDDLQQAYEDLSELGVLKLNTGNGGRSGFDQEEAEKMPLDELARRAAQATRRY